MIVQRDRWTTKALVREAVRNIRTSRRRLWPLLSFAVVAGVALAILAAVESVQLRSDLATLALSGRNVVVFGSASEVPASIDRNSCDRLAASPSVERAGAILSSRRGPILPLGGAIPMVPVSATLLPELKNADAVVGSALSSGSQIRTIMVDGIPLSAARGLPQPEGIPVNQAVAVAAPVTVVSVERCVVVLSAGADQEVMIPLLAAQLVVDGAPPTGAAVLTEPIDRIAAYYERLTRWLPLVVGALGGLITAGIAATRSNEFAAYRISGTSRRSLLLIYGIEAAILAGVMGTSASLASVALAGWISDVAATGFGALAGAGSWLVAALMGFLPLNSQSVLTVTKER